MKCKLCVFLLEMDISKEANGKYAVRALSDISSASSAGAKVQMPPFSGGHMQFDPSFTSSKPMGNRKVKFICSSGGKILPRPSDMKLRYVGGETRMVSLPRYIQYAAFHSKMVELYGLDIALRYQLPEEDLDALVSVSADEDLENMMEECDRLSAGEGSSKLRVFVFSASELDVHDPADMAEFKSSERKFVDAINAYSEDFLPGMHIASIPGKSYANTDSFNDAYKAWNGIHSENYESSGNPHRFESVMPNQVPGSIAPFTYSNNVMGQRTLPDKFPVADALGNDLEFSSRFFQDDFLKEYAENQWAETHVHKDSTSDDRGEDKAYKIQHSFTEQNRGKRNHLYIPKVLTCDVREVDQAYKMEEPSTTEHAMRELGIEPPFNGVETVDDSIKADSQVPNDLPILSHGAFLQRELMSSSPSPLLEKEVEPGMPSGKILDVHNLQHVPVSSVVKDQQQSLCEQHVLQEYWARRPVYDSSFGLDQGNQGHGHLDGHSSGIHIPVTSGLLFLSNESSDADFPMTSAPFSPSSQKVQADIRYDVVSEHIDPRDKFTAGFSTADIDTLTQASTNVSSIPKMPEKRVQMHMTSIPGQKLTQDFSHNNPTLCIGTDTKLLPFASSLGMSQNRMVNRSQYIQKPLNVFSDAPSTMAASYELTGQSFGLQNGEVGNNFLPCVEKGHSLSEKTFMPCQGDIDDAYQQRNEPIEKFSHLNDASLQDIRDNSHSLDMLSDLLESCQTTECLPVPSSTAESLRSRSVSSQEDEPQFQDRGNLTSREGGEGSELPISTHGKPHHPTFDAVQNSMPSKEQFEQAMASPFQDTFNNETSLFTEDRFTRNRLDTSIPVSYPPQAPALTSLIENWEASLLQDEDEHYTGMQHHLMDEQAREEINPNPIFDREVVLEDSQLEFEEVDEFESFDYGPTNAAAIAEQEAIARGLQMVQNCDLEELRELGSGTFGTVYHGKWRGTDVAIKRIKASCFTGRQAERDRLVADFWREAYILGQLHHPNVVAFYGVVPDGPGGTLATVTEYMVNGSLKQVLQNKDRTLDRRKRLLIAMDAAFGMEYLHGKNVVHFDIKCENLLVNLKDAQRPICKVGDLGLSKVKQQTFVSGGVRGTLPWMAPELLNGSSSLVSEKVDVFSFGIVMWELLTGEEPYANMHYGAIIGGIVNNTLRPTVPRWCDPAWKSLMEKCWAADPGDRPTFLEIARTLRAMEAAFAAKGQCQARILDMYQ